MDLISTLFPALIGYYFLKSSRITRLTIPHESGYHLFFKSALAGYILVGIPFVCGSVLARFFNSAAWIEYLSDKWEKLLPFDFYVGAYFVGIVMGAIWLLLEKAFYDESAGFIKAAKERGDHLGAFVAEALGSEMLIEVTLRNRKSYIGYPLSMKNGQNADIELVPLQSGYRDKNTQRLVMETDYTAVFLERRDIAASEVRVIVPSTELVTVKPFDPLLYVKFQELNPGTPPLPGSEQ